MTFQTAVLALAGAPAGRQGHESEALLLFTATSVIWGSSFLVEPGGAAVGGGHGRRPGRQSGKVREMAAISASRIAVTWAAAGHLSAYAGRLRHPSAPVGGPRAQVSGPQQRSLASASLRTPSPVAKVEFAG